MGKENINKMQNFESWISRIKNNIINMFFKKIISAQRTRVNEKQLSFIAKSLGQIYKDGIPINKALALVEESVADKNYKKSLKNIIKRINEGDSLSEAFKGNGYLYPKLFIGLIFIGENTGKLYEILIQLGSYYEKSSQLKSQVKMACIYPSIILISTIVLIVVFISRIIPSFYSIYNSMGITPSYFYTAVYNFQAGFKENFIINMSFILCWSAVTIIVMRCILSNTSFNYPMKLKIVKDILEYMTILIFSIIINSGINILQGLEYCNGSITPEYLNCRVVGIRNSILEGKTLTEALEESKLLSNYTLSVIRVREETGSIDEGFKNISLNLEKEIYKKVNNYLKALSPLLVIIMGILICIFISVFVMPLFKEMQNGIR